MTNDHEAVSFTRILPSPCPRVYEAWTEPEMLARWLAPGRQAKVISARADSRIGGAFLIELRYESGSTFRYQGTYLDVTKNKSVALSWQYDGPAEYLRGESLVEVCLRSIDSEATELRLTHTLLSGVAVTAYRAVWLGCLEKLADALEADYVVSLKRRGLRHVDRFI